MDLFELKPEDVHQIAQLYRLGITEDEIEQFRGQLAQILESFQILNNVDTDTIYPTEHSGDVSNIMRLDEPKNPLDKEDVLSNAPLEEKGFFRVKAVLE